MKTLKLAFGVVVIVLLTCQCRDDDDLDPCDIEGLAPVTAAFTTSYEMGWQDSIRRFEVDTFIDPNFVIFTALQENATYHWTVGDDPRVFDQKEFTLNFNDVGSSINIRLIVNATPNLECFPDDDGQDTISKTIYFFDIEESLMLGVFRGVVSSAPNDTFNIDIHLIPPYNDDSNIDNLPNGCIRDEVNRLSFRPGYKELRMGSLGNLIECPQPQGWGTLDSDRLLTLEYTIWDPAIQELTSDSFIGKKIN